MWKKYDADGSGTLDKTEAIGFIQDVIQQMHAAKVGPIQKQKKSKEQKAYLKQQNDLFAALGKKGPEIFAIFDTNGDGEMDREEFEIFLQTSYKEPYMITMGVGVEKPDYVFKMRMDQAKAEADQERLQKEREQEQKELEERMEREVIQVYGQGFTAEEFDEAIRASPKKMENITEFYGGQNAFTQIPSMLLKANNLKHFLIHANPIEAVPENFGDLFPQLVQLSIMDTQIKKFPSSMGKLTNLIQLSAESFDDFPDLSALAPNLKKCALTVGSKQGICPQWISKFSELESLQLNGYADLSALNDATLSNCTLLAFGESKSLPQNLKMPALEWIDLKNCTGVAGFVLATNGKMDSVTFEGLGYFVFFFDFLSLFLPFLTPRCASRKFRLLVCKSGTK
jgi:hypothetical protein